MHSPSHTVALALSGGLDSAVAAVLLKAEGWRIQGVYFRLPAPEAVRQARLEAVEGLARFLEIPLDQVDLGPAFEADVVAPFVRAYLAGLTPNPCAVCNARIKFAVLSRVARERGLAFIATGHYAQARPGANGAPGLLQRGRDRGKDQSYFLHRLSGETLGRTVFPLGALTKQEIRVRARVLGLPCAEAPESQEICFLAGTDYRDFVRQRAAGEAEAPGPVVDAQGHPLTTHAGIYRYTVGQRHGLGIASSEPYYVQALRPQSREVVVGRRAALFSSVAVAEECRWIAGRPPQERDGLEAQIRYRHRAATGRLEILGPGRVRFTFDTPQWAVTPGQALVCYREDEVLGGGWIVGAEG